MFKVYWEWGLEIVEDFEEYWLHYSVASDVGVTAVGCQIGAEAAVAIDHCVVVIDERDALGFGVGFKLAVEIADNFSGLDVGTP